MLGKENMQEWCFNTHNSPFKEDVFKKYLMDIVNSVT
jgi:hypothetical protein